MVSKEAVEETYKDVAHRNDVAHPLAELMKEGNLYKEVEQARADGKHLKFRYYGQPYKSGNLEQGTFKIRQRTVPDTIGALSVALSGEPALVEQIETGKWLTELYNREGEEIDQLFAEDADNDVSLLIGTIQKYRQCAVTLAFGLVELMNKHGVDIDELKYGTNEDFLNAE